METSDPTPKRVPPDDPGAVALDKVFEGDVEVIQIDPKNWRLAKDLTYKGEKEQITVPASFETDFASVPRPFVWLVPRYGIYTPAAILHDFLCREGVRSRSECDRIFREAMNDLKVALLRRWIMWAAVRVSILRGDGLNDLGRWLLVAIPSATFVLVPAVVILAWLAIFWVIEQCVYLPMRLLGKKANRPRLRVRLS